MLAARGTVYMVMRLETGDSLRAWREKLGRAPTQAELDRILAPLLDALEVMHASNFLHRDIEPDSIVIRPDGSPVLLGFGATRKVTAEEARALTRVFKPGFSPPEQYVGDGRGQGPWTDIYALGGTVYWLLSGDAPPDATVRMIEDPMRPASAMTGTGYRPGFLAALDRASLLAPRERPQSIAEWRAELLRDSAPAAAPASIDPTSIDPASAAPASSASAPPRPPRLGRARLAIAAVAVFIAVGAIMALASLRVGPPPEGAASRVETGSRSGASTSTEGAPGQAEGGKRIALAIPPPGPSPSAPAMPPPPGWDLTLVADIRAALNRVGCRTDATSAAWADADQKALEGFARHTGGVHAFLALNRDIVRVVSAHSARVCPVTCAAGEAPSGDRCVRTPAPDCTQIGAINERAQIGLASEEELQLLRSGPCKP